MLGDFMIETRRGGGEEKSLSLRNGGLMILSEGFQGVWGVVEISMREMVDG